MKTIYKYEVHPDEYTVEMPEGAVILDVQFQPHTARAQLWALVDPEATTVARRLVTVATGQPLPDDVDALYVYRGTFQFPDGLVFHLFDGGEAP